MNLRRDGVALLLERHDRPEYDALAAKGASLGLPPYTVAKTETLRKDLTLLTGQGRHMSMMMQGGAIIKNQLR